jgi:hypothetical protein
MLDDHELDALMRQAAPPQRDDDFILGVIERMELDRRKTSWLRGLAQPAAVAAGAVGGWLMLKLFTQSGALTLDIDLGGPILLTGVVALSLLVGRQMMGAFVR